MFDKFGVSGDLHFEAFIDLQIFYLLKRAILLEAIEIAKEHVPFVVLVNFFPSFEQAKNLLIMVPNNTKN